jgi:Domain of Unknown Function with PDB structure (DUF3857)/Transglutaminase-like superfamily
MVSWNEDFALDTILRRCLPFLLFLFSVSAFAQSWIQPTPEELKMTSEPAAPDAAAIYLYREERADDKLHIHSIYVRLKILTEKGKEYADVEVPYEGHNFGIRAVEGRTIHSDGTIIPFSGKPYEKLLVKTKTERYMAKVFTLPDVQVGSILEYRYVISYDDNIVYSPQWFVQQPLYVRKAHYQFLPTQHRLDDGHGGSMDAQVRYFPLLPKGAEVQYIQTEKIIQLDIEKIPPVEEEEYMPPMSSVSYRVLFYYTLSSTAEAFWKEEGKYWSRNIDKFMSPNKLTGIVNQIVAPADTPRQKVEKIYDAVMKLDNSSFDRDHSRAEDKAEGITIKTAADIWDAKRGSADDLTLLFVGLVRAAGFKAYVAAVTNRDRAIFMKNYLAMRQLDDDIAIVELDGKEEYFDPGERYCTLGQLHWKHTVTGGIRQTDSGAVIFDAPLVGYKTTTVLRSADLSLNPDGSLHGTMRITLTGNKALYWRQRALSTDEDAIKKEFEESVQSTLPPGVQIKIGHFLGLTDYDKNLMATLEVKGSMGTATAKRVFLPTLLFESGSKPLFVHDKRTVPVDLQYPYGSQDTVVIHLPPSWTVESAPKDTKFPLPNNALYQTTVKQEPGQLDIGRVFVLANSSFPVDEYSGLKDFYQKVNARDQEQAVLQPASATAQTGSAK